MEAATARRKAIALVALAASTLFLITIAAAVWIYATRSPGVDFASFWAAGRLAMIGRPELAYDLQVHRSIEMTVAHMGGLMPFPYPPPFLFVVAPFALEPFWLAYLAWIVATAAIYFAATRTFLSPRYAFAHPAALINAIIGQNGFLTSGIFIWGLRLLDSQPVAAGALFGLLIIKPQLAILIPVALLAAREWRAIAGGAASSICALALAALVYGIGAYAGFAEMSRNYGAFMAADRWNWAETASVFGFFRGLGVAQPVALALQAVSASAAAILTWRAWSRGSENRAEVLASATLLVPPYVLSYDSLLLILPLAGFLRDEARPWRLPIVWVLLVVPLGGYLGLYPGPNTIPIAAGLCLLWTATDFGQKKSGGAFRHRRPSKNA